MDDTGRYVFQCTTTELEVFFDSKVWRVDIKGLFQYALDGLREETSSPDGPDGTELAHLRGRIEQVLSLLELEEFVMDEKKEQLEEKKSDG
jgi:hypothetical protein